MTDGDGTGDLSGYVQKAFYQTLVNDVAMSSLVAGRVYDYVPEAPTSIDDVEADARFPYIRLGDDVWSDYGDKDTPGQIGTCSFHIFSRARSNEQLQLINRRMNELFHERILTLDVGEMVLLRFSTSLNLADPDGITRHRVVRYQVIVTLPTP